MRAASSSLEGGASPAGRAGRAGRASRVFRGGGGFRGGAGRETSGSSRESPGGRPGAALSSSRGGGGGGGASAAEGAGTSAGGEGAGFVLRPAMGSGPRGFRADLFFSPPEGERGAGAVRPIFTFRGGGRERATRRGRADGARALIFTSAGGAAARGSGSGAAGAGRGAGRGADSPLGEKSAVGGRGAISSRGPLSPARDSDSIRTRKRRLPGAESVRARAANPARRARWTPADRRYRGAIPSFFFIPFVPRSFRLMALSREDAGGSCPGAAPRRGWPRGPP